MNTNVAEHRYIPLAILSPSPLNHRKHFDEEKLAELADSIRSKGVIQPIVARPTADGNFEVVAGERRYRAAKAAGLDEIPAVVRELTDAETIELQVIENAQRVDVHPLEEAEGYEALMKCQGPDGHPYSADDIALKIGMKRGYVYGRLKLLALCPEGRKAMIDGQLNASTALLIARIPVPKLQAKAVKEIVEPEYEDQPLSFRDAKSHVEQHYMLRLKEAPFKPSDASLVPAAGACGVCPKRTGNQPELFADIAGADICTDPQCFDQKRKAAADRKRDEAIASGRTVITGREAKKIMPYEYSSPKGYVRLDAACYEDPKNRNYRQLLGKAAGDAILLEKPSAPGEFVEVLPNDVVAAALEKKGYQFAKEVDRSKEDAKNKLQREVDGKTRLRAYIAFRTLIAQQGLGPDELRALISQMADYDMPCTPLLELWGASVEDVEGVGIDLEDLIKKAPNEQLLPMLLDAAFSDPTYPGRGWESLAKARGVDMKAIEREVKAEIKAKAKAAAEEALAE